LLTDSYSAVRYIACESLKQHPQYKSLRYDFDAPPRERAAGRERVLETWRKGPRELAEDRARRLLMDAQGRRRESEIERLLKSQDPRRIVVLE
jgi:hypothetical protein